MTFIDALSSLADKFHNKINTVNGCIPLYTADYGWDNYRYTSPIYRLAHVEKFVQDRFAVVHVCIFPHIDDPSPIYGFDVIAGEQKATGLFFDLSPTVRPTELFSALSVERPRERPEWGDIFSEHWVACRPTLDDFNVIAQEALTVLDRYLSTLGKEVFPTTEIICGQNRYCQQQKRNNHTKAALVKIIGSEAADEFMNTVLFPEVPMSDSDINII